MWICHKWHFYYNCHCISYLELYCDYFKTCNIIKFFKFLKYSVLELLVIWSSLHNTCGFFVLFCSMFKSILVASLSSLQVKVIYYGLADLALKLNLKISICQVWWCIAKIPALKRLMQAGPLWVKACSKVVRPCQKIIIIVN